MICNIYTLVLFLTDSQILFSNIFWVKNSKTGNQFKLQPFLSLYLDIWKNASLFIFLKFNISFWIKLWETNLKYSEILQNRPVSSTYQQYFYWKLVLNTLKSPKVKLPGQKSSGGAEWGQPPWPVTSLRQRVTTGRCLSSKYQSETSCYWSSVWGRINWLLMHYDLNWWIWKECWSLNVHR